MRRRSRARRAQGYRRACSFHLHLTTAKVFLTFFFGTAERIVFFKICNCTRNCSYLNS